MHKGLKRIKITIRYIVLPFVFIDVTFHNFTLYLVISPETITTYTCMCVFARIISMIHS